jgi:hypothetical protein
VNYGRDNFSAYQKARANPAPTRRGPIRSATDADNDEIVNNFDLTSTC